MLPQLRQEEPQLEMTGRLLGGFGMDGEAVVGGRERSFAEEDFGVGPCNDAHSGGTEQCFDGGAVWHPPV